MYNINISNQGKIMRKLLGKQSAESSHEPSLLSAPSATTAVSAGITSSPFPHVLPYRTSASQNAVYDAGVPIGAIDRSPDGHSAILAGPHVLRTVNFIDGVTIKEGVDLRALITSQPAPRGNAASSTADQRSIKDVKWGTGNGNTTIFTACSTGKIFQYDLARFGPIGSPVDTIQIREDSRQINTLDINPHRGTYLLSGSQDGIVRCFDIRMPVHTRTGLTFRAVQAFKCNADAVRQVKWSPKDGFNFACGTEQGAVLKWDMRKHNAPTLRINAHERTCSSISWHPDGEHLVSAGWDSKCNVWDMSKTADKRQKPKWTIMTPAPVGAVSWRPGQWSATAQAKRASQIAVSYDESGQKRFGINAVHIWDLARPTMPYKEIQRFDNSPSAMLWHDQSLLWTGGHDGLFNQCDVAFAPKVIDRQAVSTMAFSARGDVLMFLDERPPTHRPRPQISHPDAMPSYTSAPATPKYSISRSDSEDDAVGSFLGPKRRGSRKRRQSTRSAVALSTTPPTGTGIDEVLSLDQTIKVTGTYRPQQTMAIGHVPASAKVDVYEYLSVNYLETLYRELPYVAGGKSMPERVADILEHYAKAAEYVNQFRLAQTWRILAYGIDLVLRRRADYHLQFRMSRVRGSFSMKKKSQDKVSALHPFELSIHLPPTDGEATPRKVMSAVSLDKTGHPRSLLSEELESTSNVPTPIARPVSDTSDATYIHDSGKGKKLTPILEPESFTLPPSIHAHAPRKRLDSVPLSTTSHDSEMSHASVEGYDFYDAEAISKAIDVPVPKSSGSQSRSFEAPGLPNGARKPATVRHDSEESLGQMFSLSDGSRQTTGLTSSSTSSSFHSRPSALAGFQRPSGSDDGEFASRVRGKQLSGSPGNLNGAFRSPLHRSETDMTGYTDEHHIITQTTSGSFDSPFPSQEADFAVESPTRMHSSGLESPDDDDFLAPYITERDYLPWPNDPPYPYPTDGTSNSFTTTSSPPLQPYSLITRALAFETKSSALNASAIILLFKPLIPDDIIDSFQAAAILRQQHSRLMSMKLFVEATLLRKLCMKGWPNPSGGPLANWGENYQAIFAPAQQGVQAGFFCSRCNKPRDIDRSSDSKESIWCCERCKGAMAPCAVCGHRDGTPNLPPKELAVALGKLENEEEEEEQEGILSTWWYCPGCGHGGHSSCMQGWHSAFESSECHDYMDVDALDSSDGCCPLDGCGHACLPGRWRAESAAARTEEVSRAVREATNRARVAAGGEAALGGVGLGSDRHHHFSDYSQGNGHEHGQGVSGRGSELGGGVRSDGHDVAQSRAVESVREALAVSGGGAGAGMGGASGYSTPQRVATSILSSSPGRPVGERVERERRKSVKFVETSDAGL
ncbi:WD repeat-containing protein 24 [Naviculisporaceae sp. PSN 640]